MGVGGSEGSSTTPLPPAVSPAPAPPCQAPAWAADEEGFRRWKEGRTGWPLVDANMRELAATGGCGERARSRPAAEPKRRVPCALAPRLPLRTGVLVRRRASSQPCVRRRRLHVQPRPPERGLLPGPALNPAPSPCPFPLHQASCPTAGARTRPPSWPWTCAWTGGAAPTGSSTRCSTMMSAGGLRAVAGCVAGLRRGRGGARPQRCCSVRWPVCWLRALCWLRAHVEGSSPGLALE